MAEALLRMLGTREKSLLVVDRFYWTVPGELGLAWRTHHRVVTMMERRGLIEASSWARRGASAREYVCEYALTDEGVVAARLAEKSTPVRAGASGEPREPVNGKSAAAGAKEGSGSASPPLRTPHAARRQAARPSAAAGTNQPHQPHQLPPPEA